MASKNIPEPNKLFIKNDKFGEEIPIVNVKEIIRKFEKEIQNSKKEKMVKKVKGKKICRQIPAELMNELFGSLPLENAFSLLAKMANGLLARNIQKMIESIKMAMKSNKLNTANCGSRLIISEDGLVAKYFDPEGGNHGVRAVLPNPAFNFKSIVKPRISFYYEIEILSNPIWSCNAIGFCDQYFPLEFKYLGLIKNSIGIWWKDEILIDGNWIKFGFSGEFFKDGDLVGIGIIHYPNSKMRCFATWNGKLLGKAELPTKFVNVQLFPAFVLPQHGYSVRVNFGKDKWSFTEFGRLLQ